jgi:hypothetical protein
MDHFSHLFNAHRVSDVRHTKIHTAELPVFGPGAFNVEMTTDKIKRHKSPETEQIPTKSIKTGGQNNSL